LDPQSDDHRLDVKFHGCASCQCREGVRVFRKPTAGQRPAISPIKGPDGAIVDETPVDSKADGEAMLVGILPGLDEMTSE
jgi:hypothetical protein